MLRKSAPVVMETDKKTVTAGILGQVNKTGIAVFENIVHQFLDDAEYDQLVFWFQAFAVIVEAGAGVHAAGAADLLE